MTPREIKMVALSSQLADQLVKMVCEFMAIAAPQLTHTEQATVPIGAVTHLVATIAAGYKGDPEDYLDQLKVNLDLPEVRKYMADVRKSFLDAKRKAEIKGVRKQ